MKHFENKNNGSAKVSLSDGSGAVIVAGAGPASSGREVALLACRRRTLKSLSFALLAILPLPMPARAQQADRPVVCEAGEHLAALRTCENARYREAVRGMDAAHERILVKLDPRGQAKLRASQSAWLRYRSTEAEFHAEFAKGGTLARLISVTVHADLTEERRRDLERMAAELK